MPRITTFFRLTANQKWLVSEAFACLILARAAVITLPFRWIASVLGHQNIASANTDQMAMEFAPLLRKVSWAIWLVSKHVPWNSNCLAQAIAGHCMLRRRHIPSTLYFGMTKNSDGQLEAHAWLSSGGIILTGKTEFDRYAVVATFTQA